MTPFRQSDGKSVAMVPVFNVLKQGRIIQKKKVGVRYYKFQPISFEGRELLYIFSIVCPRFVNLSVREKIETIMHELYHISPRFDGSPRVFPGRNRFHGNMKAYDAKAARFADEWLASDPDQEFYEFLRYDLAGLRSKFGKVHGNHFKKFGCVEITREEAFLLEPSLRPEYQGDVLCR